jgi:hypothetical protein
MNDDNHYCFFFVFVLFIYLNKKKSIIYNEEDSRTLIHIL